MANPLLGYWYRLYMKQTKHEQILEKKLCLLGVRYRTQHPFFNIDGHISAYPDFYLPDNNLVIEVDDPKHSEPERIKKDRQRTKALNGLGITVVRFTNEQVETDIKSVMDSIRAVVFPVAKTPSLPITPEPKKRGRPRKTSSVERRVFDSPD